jgi:hypothetical protein
MVPQVEHPAAKTYDKNRADVSETLRVIVLAPIP